MSNVQTPTTRAKAPAYTVAEPNMIFRIVGGSLGPGTISLAAARQISEQNEANLQAQINAEVQARQKGDSDEATARAAADTKERNERIAADNAEAQTRATADTTEASTRAAADTALGNRIAVLEALTPRRAIITYAGADFTWTYPTAFPAGTVPVISAVVVGRTTDNGLLNCQIVGDPTNTSCRVRVNNVANSSVSLLGIVNLNLFSQAPSGVKVHLVAYLP